MKNNLITSYHSKQDISESLTLIIAELSGGDARQFSQLIGLSEDKVLKMCSGSVAVPTPVKRLIEMIRYDKGLQEKPYFYR